LEGRRGLGVGWNVERNDEVVEGEAVWAQGIIAILGVWLLASPEIMEYGGQARVNNQVVGVWMATFGMIALSESMRAMRWATLALGMWLVCAPFALDYPDERASGSIVAGIAAMGLASVRGKLSERFGGGWSELWKQSE
jgi:hypothetical protein